MVKITLQDARDTIFSQENLPLGVKRSAWLLYKHELGRIDPKTGTFYTPRAALRNVMKWIAGQRAQTRMRHITPRERSVLKLLMEGLAIKQVAQEMQISEAAVKRHLARMRGRFNMVSTYQVIALAVWRGWVQPPRMDN